MPFVRSHYRRPAGTATPRGIQARLRRLEKQLDRLKQQQAQVQAKKKGKGKS